MIAVYEKDFACRWRLVVHHQGLPSKSVNGGSVDRYGEFKVPANMIDIDGTPNFGMIAKAFPAPAMELAA